MQQATLEDPANDRLSNRPTIVIAEDSRIQGKVLEKRLNALGYDIHLGADGKQALELVRKYQPSVVVSDIEMPGMSGYELCKAIKSDQCLQNTPVILLSTLSDTEDIIRGLNAGADNYITKPYSISRLVARIEALRTQPNIVQEDEDMTLDVVVQLEGKSYTVRSGRRQALNLLVSTFENAVEKNKELHRTNEQLILAREQLTNRNGQLESLNKQLGDLNAKMVRDLEAAAKVQQSLLPNESLDSDRIAIAWNYIPCDELGGDFLNFALLDEHHLAAYVVDVSGHGAASALLAVAIGRVLSPVVSATSLITRIDPFTGGRTVTAPATVVRELNRRFPMDSQGGLHFTILYGVLDLRSNVFRYACGGHPQPVVVSKNGDARLTAGDGFAVGWIEDAEFDEFSLQLSSGDRLFLYSDGIPEALDAELEQLTNGRMLSEFKRSSHQELPKQVNLLCNVVQDWCSPNGPRDDISILAIEIKDTEIT